MSYFNTLTHYYGDEVRRIFIAGAVIMVATLPFEASKIALPILFSVLGFLIVVVAAGITSPKFVWSAIVDIFISVLAVMEFEWYAVDWYSRHGAHDPFFWINQTLAIMFLFAIYFSVKTFRGVRDEALEMTASGQKM